MLAGWSVSSFYHISVTVQNRTHVHMNFLLRITHTIISQNIAGSSWITLYNHYANFIRRMMLSSVTCPALLYVSTLCASHIMLSSVTWPALLYVSTLCASHIMLSSVTCPALMYVSTLCASHIMLSSVTCPALLYVSTLCASHNMLSSVTCPALLCVSTLCAMTFGNRLTWIACFDFL